MVNVDCLHLKTTFSGLLPGKTIDNTSRILIKDAGDKTLEAMPLISVTIHVLFSLQQDHSAFRSGVVRGKFERNLEVVKDGFVGISRGFFNWTRVLFELDSKFEEFDGDFSLDFRIERLVPSFVSFTRHLFDVFWEYLQELFGQLVFCDHIFNVDIYLMEHAQLFLA